MKFNENNYNIGFFDFKQNIELTIKELNQLYKENDVLFFMGNWEMELRKIGKVREDINCNNIYFLFGNNDIVIRENMILLNYYWTYKSSVFSKVIIEDKRLGLTKHVTDFSVEAKDLFNETFDMYFIEFNDKPNVVLSHYPLLDWKNKENGTLNFYSVGNSTDKNSVKIEKILKI
jgi:calcineurin-like phosphoesterase family protein